MKQVNNENIIKGLLGSFLGSFIGILIIVLFSNFGIVASISGFVMASLTIRFYKNYSGNISKIGLLLCVIVMVVMTLVAHNLSVTLEIAKVQNQAGYTPDVIYIFTHIFYFLRNGYIKAGYYISRLVLLYLFMFIGAYNVISSNIRNLK